MGHNSTTDAVNTSALLGLNRRYSVLLVSPGDRRRCHETVLRRYPFPWAAS
jgi:hypothetical protein